MQRNLLSATPWIRVVDAPTGSGKSHAFMRAVWPKTGEPFGNNVLFIAPTRRLTEALSEGLIKGLAAELAEVAPHVPAVDREDCAREAVLVWNGTQVAFPGQTKAQLRLNQIAAVQKSRHTDLPVLGRTAFTVLEILRDLLFPQRLLAGAVDEKARHVLRRFKFVVFDEFHTLGEDGVALALVIVALVREMNRDAERLERELGFPHPRILVSFLSATPVDLVSFLSEGLGNPLPVLDPSQSGEGVCLIQEEVIHDDEPCTLPPSHRRPIHGAVRLHLVETDESEGLEALGRAQMGRIVEEIRQSRQVVFVFDAKGDAMQQLENLGRDIKDACCKAGVATPLIGIANASDDRARCTDGSGTMSLESADVLLATSSVEFGVSFRRNRLLFMDPGTSLISFIQRIGRCARGHEEGDVWVRASASTGCDRRIWWGVLAKMWADPNGPFPESLRIDRFVSTARQKVEIPRGASCLQKKEAGGSSSGPPLAGFYATEDFGRRARIKAAFFWAAVWVILGKRYREVDEAYMGRPPRLVRKARVLLLRVDALRRDAARQLLKRVARNPPPRQYSYPFQPQAFFGWLASWRQDLLCLRDIEPAVWVIDCTGTGAVRARPFERSWLWQWTDAFHEGEPVSAAEANRSTGFGFHESDHVWWIRGGRPLKIFTSEERRIHRRSQGESRYSRLYRSPWSTAGTRSICLEDGVKITSKQLAGIAEMLQKSPGCRGMAATLKELASFVSQIARAPHQESSLDEDAGQWADLIL